MVVLDHNGDDMTDSCVQRLLAWAPEDVEFEVVVVDNGSARPVAERLTPDPRVQIRRSVTNLGFAGGANLGLHDLDDVDYVALVNNDVEVTNGWLEPLLERLRADPAVGAASPKMLFDGRFQSLELASPATRQRGDPRALGVRVHRVETASPATTAVQFASGFYGPEYGGAALGWFQWTQPTAVLNIPRGPGRGPCTVELSADRPKSVTLRSGDRTTRVEVTTEPEAHRVELGDDEFDVLNNAGSVVRPDGYGLDRGLMEPDRGQYDRSERIQAWCGGAVLLRAEYLRDVGLFDERLFLYYEDLELSLRGAPSWAYHYEPRSIVRHRHGATARHGSTRTEVLKERNRLLVHARYASRQETVRAVLRFLLATLSYARRDVALPLLRGRPPTTRIVRRRITSFVQFVRLLPTMRRSPGPAHIHEGAGR